MTNLTRKIDLGNDRDSEIQELIEKVHEALVEKGYNPISQFVGYIMSGDPTYITGHNGARSLIVKFERDEILEVILKKYLGDIDAKKK